MTLKFYIFTPPPADTHSTYTYSTVQYVYSYMTNILCKRSCCILSFKNAFENKLQTLFVSYKLHYVYTDNSRHQRIASTTNNFTKNKICTSIQYEQISQQIKQNRRIRN